MKKNNKINFNYYLRQNKTSIFFYTLVYAIASCCGIFITIIFADAIQNITLASQLADTLYVKKAINCMLIVAGLVVIKRLSWYISGFIYQKFAANIMAKLNLDLANQAFKLNSKTYADHDTGTFVQRIVNDPERVVYSISNIIDRMFDIISSLIIVIYITTLNYLIGLCIIGLIFATFIIEFFRVKVRRKNRSLVRRSYDKINSLTTEIVRSEKDIKSLGLEDKLSQVSKISYDDYKKISFKTDFVDANFYSSRNFLIEFCTIFILILGIIYIDKGLITLATFMIVYSNSNSIYSLVWGTGNVLTLFTDIKISCERMFALFDDSRFTCEKFGNKKVENVKGKIEFKNVSYSYVEYEKEDYKKKKNEPQKEKKIVSKNNIFQNLSFSIKPNTTVAFVGKSGSGKSTILNLMSKMYEVDEGQVLIDGVNINDFDKESLRKTISLVNQFPYIFDMTIKENLILAKKDATDEEIISAITKASLKDFIDTLPNGIDTKVGESGIKLSGGQKQRLAIARALLRNSPIIIFDESTSSLDNFAQEEVKKSIDALKGKSTVIIVAHRLSTIKNVDQIFFLDNGKIEDVGNFEELFNNNEKFKAMFLVENI